MDNKPELDPAIIARIISRIPHERTLKGILKEEGLSATKFFDYLLVHPNWERAYSLSQSARAELLADEIIDISDTETDPQRARNRIDARKWVASKLKASKFGDRIDVNVNHTVDISEALKDARSRTNLLPQRDTSIDAVAQLIDMTPNVDVLTTVPESVESENPLKSLDDIFT